MSSSSSHTSPFSHRPGARIPSNSSSGSSSWHDHNRWSTNPDDMEHSFTSDMRDRQARGKDPYADDDSSENGVRDMGVHGMGMRLSGGGGNVASRCVMRGGVVTPHVSFFLLFLFLFLLLLLLLLLFLFLYFLAPPKKGRLHVSSIISQLTSPADFQRNPFKKPNDVTGPRRYLTTPSC